MKDIVSVEICAIKSEARVDTRILADRLGNQHEAVIKLIDSYQSDFESIGVVRFEIEKPKTGTKGGRPERYALLSEDQSYLLLTFSRNTKRVRELKVELVKAFARFRQHKQIEVDYLPYYGELHDSVKSLSDHARQHGSTTEEKIFHVNFNRLINKTFGLESGQRKNLPGHVRAGVTMANLLAKDAIEHAIRAGLDHHAAYAEAKVAVQSLAAIASLRLEGV